MPAAKKTAAKKAVPAKKLAPKKTTPAKEAVSKPASGFGPATFEFYEGLEADNSKTYWDAHKSIYLDAVKAPMEDLLEALKPEFGQWHVFRPNRDVRFSKDKRPYKEQMGGYAAIEDGVGYYVAVSARGLQLGGGWWQATSPQIARYRDAVAGHDGAELEKYLVGLRKAKLNVDGDMMKTVPRGFAADHPRAELLKYRTMTFTVEHDAAAWMDGPQLLKNVRSLWRTCQPALEWFAAHVGPAEEPDAEYRR